MVKIGFIGFGRFAKLRYDILSRMQGVHLIGYFDPDNNLSLGVDLKRFCTVDSLLDLSDAVFVSVPPSFAPDLCRWAFSKSVHVFCEKPPAAKLADLDVLEKYSKEMILAYGFNHRLHDSVITARETVDSGKMGKILWMRGRYGKEVDHAYKDTWRCNKELNGGGILIDQGIHLLDIMDLLAGGFDINQSLLSDKFLNIRGVEDNAFVNLYSSQNKISASLHSTITQWRYLFSLEIFLEGGAIILNGLRTSSGNYGEETLSIRHNAVRSLTEKTEDQEIKYSINNSWEKEIAAFVRSVEVNSVYPYAGLREAKNIMALLESIYSGAVWTN